MKTCNIVIAGFGGQGILFAGKVLAYAGMNAGHHISWLPSYGPEMRGGTANCSVVVSDELIGSPIVLAPDLLIAMNKPSLDRFEEQIVPGGRIFADQSLVGRKVRRNDVEAYYIDATKIAMEIKKDRLANMVMLGYVLKQTGLFSEQEAETAIRKCLPASKEDLVKMDMEAVLAGYRNQN